MMNTNSFPDDLMLSAVYVARRLWTMCLWIHGQAKQSMSKCEWDHLSSFSIPLQQSVSLFLCFPSSPPEINYNLVDWQKWQCFSPTHYGQMAQLDEEQHLREKELSLSANWSRSWKYTTLLMSPRNHANQCRYEAKLIKTTIQMWWQ